MFRPGKNFTGNDRFYGFCVDLLELVAGMAGFDYEMEKMPPNSRYGSFNSTTLEWDGMVKIIIDKVEKTRVEI